MSITRRGLLVGVIGSLCAPAIVRAQSLMPIYVPKALYVASNRLLTPEEITREALLILHEKMGLAGNVNREFDWSWGADSGKKIVLRIRQPFHAMQS